MNTRLLIALALVALTGCGRSERDGPPTIRYGIDACAHCGMIISDARYAAATIALVDGEQRALLFDDIGDQLDYAADHAEIKPIRRYVHDHQTRDWVSADAAQYVHAPSLHTPMGSGIAAFASAASAHTFADAHTGDGATLASFEALTQRLHTPPASQPTNPPAASAAELQ